jgi:hypothetical protein
MYSKRAVPLGIVFFVVFAASNAFGDSIHSNKFANLNGIEHRALHVIDLSRAENEGYLFAGIHPNNGRHLGFSAAAIHRGPQLGIVRPVGPSVTQNPEPATMVLLGTGLAAVGAAIRRRRKA